jgi:hypothetical protein
MSNGIHTDGWRGDSGALPITLTFDFAGLVDVEYVGLWQYFSDREGTADFSLVFFDGAGGTGNAIGGAFNAFLDPVGIAQGNIPLNRRSFDVGLRSGVQSITMQINSIAREVNPFVHLGEFMVGATQEVPEARHGRPDGAGAVGGRLHEAQGKAGPAGAAANSVVTGHKSRAAAW